MPAIGNTEELINTLGWAAFQMLQRQRAGKRLYVPRSIESAQQIEQWLGREKAAALVAAFGGFHIDIPTGRQVKPPSRQNIIEAYISAGWRDGDIADKVECTERAVRGYRRQLRDAALDEDGGKQLPGLKSAVMP